DSRVVARHGGRVAPRVAGVHLEAGQLAASARVEVVRRAKPQARPLRQPGQWTAASRRSGHAQLEDPCELQEPKEAVLGGAAPGIWPRISVWANTPPCKQR